MRLARITCLVVLGLAVGVMSASASLPLDPGAPPRLIAPEADATAYEGGLRFAWTPASGTSRHVLVLSTVPFDGRLWTRAIEGPEFTVVETSKPIVSLSETGLGFDRDTRLYWAAGSARSATGPVSFSETRAIQVIRKFRNRVQPSPYLESSPIGRATPETDREPERIRLAAGYTIDPAIGEPALPEAMRRSVAPQRGARTVLMFYGDADPASAREAVLAAGGKVVAYIPDHSFLVRLEGDAPFSPEVARWVGAYQPAYKVSPDLDLQPGPAYRMTVLAFPDAELEALSAAIEGTGARLLARSSNGLNKIFRIEAPGSAGTALANLEDVAWIEPYVQPTVDNVSVQWLTQTFVSNNRRLWDLGIRGEGQILHHSDSGIGMAHEMFNDGAVPLTTYGDYPTHRKVVRYEKGSPDPNIAFGDHAGASFHGSHTSGTAAGNDLTAPLSGFDGVAKSARLWHSDLGGPVLGSGIAPPVDLNDLFQPSFDGNAAGAARVSSNSWGAAAGGAYTVDAANADAFMWNHPDYLICFSNGNAGGFNTVGSPASAKNIVSVGGTGNGSIAAARVIYSSTSRGPTDDGRRKPTICSPASTVVSANNAPAVYAGLAGTSMSSPNTAGTAVLFRQYCEAGWYPTGTKVPANGFSPSAALVKAMLVNSGVNDITSFNAPDNNIGYGRICADTVLYFAGDTKRLLLVDQTEGLGHGEQIEYKVNVVNDLTSLEVALCWTDFPASVTSSLQLVNNLNLTVTNGVLTYRGNVYTAGFSATGGSYDPTNVEEAVLVRFPSVGVWTIRVQGANVPAGPQPFGLAISGGVGVTAGALALDRASYGSSSLVEVQVTDTDAGGSINVTMASTSEPAGETLTIPGADGLYASSISLSPFAGTAGDGTLHVSHGDVITATYNDASPVAAIVATANVSFNPPIITGVAASVVAGGATISWITNKSALSQVFYGDTPALGSSSPLDPLAVFTHRVALSGLTPGLTYYYDVESEDLIGNLTRDDNGGQHYTLSVPGPSELLLVYGGDLFERHNYYTTTLGELGWSYDLWSGAQSATPSLGNLSSGLRSYKAVWWQPGLEHYPPVSTAAQTAITAYLDGGGRLAMTGHDIVWALADPTSPYYSAAAAAWVNGTLRTVYNADPAGWPSIAGIALDPISDPFSGGVGYQEHRSGAAGDEVDPTGGAVASWLSGDASPDDAGIRWDSGGPLGAPGSGVWGGAPSRLATMYFEWSGVDNFSVPSSADRRDIMRRTLIWLLGRDKPTVTVTAPNGGEVLVGSSTNITWTESTDGGTGVGSRTIDYSVNGGTTWVTITGGAGPSPYMWDLTAVPNAVQALVRVTVTDNGTPSLRGSDASNASFSIQRAGGDLAGPAVTAGTVVSSPNPIDITAPATLTATISDSLFGGSTVTAAEWSFSPSPAPAGTGTPMTGAFSSIKVNVSAALTTALFAPGAGRLWVRGRDAAGNWGNAASLDLVVNGDAVTGVGDGAPARLELRQNAPNPVVGTTTFAFGLEADAKVELAIFDVAGRRVRDLVDEPLAAGLHSVSWNRTDADGRVVRPGVYYYRMIAGARTFVRRLAVLQ